MISRNCSTRLSRSPGTASKPVRPCWISSGMPLTGVVTHGTPLDMASISTTGIPSARLGSTNTSAAASCSRTCACVSAPVSVMRPCISIECTACSTRPKSGPVPTMVRWKSSPRSRKRAQACASSTWHLAGVRRPTQSRRVGPGCASRRPYVNRPGSTPRRQTCSLGHCSGSLIRINCPRTNPLMQMMSSACSTLVRRYWPGISSNSSGP